MPSWLTSRVQIQKTDIYMEARYRLSFFCSNLFPSQNQSIHASPRELLIFIIITKKGLNLGLLIIPNIACRAQQKQTSVTFPFLIIEFCRCAKVPFNKKKDFKYAPTSIVDITKIEFI